VRLLAVLACSALAAIQLPGAGASGPRGPTTFAVGQGAVWVGFGDGRVVRVPAAIRPQRTVVSPKASASGYVGGVASGFGSVWIARHDSSVLRLDDKTGRLIAVLDPGWEPSYVAAGLAAVWVVDSGHKTLFRVDPMTNRVTGRMRIRGTPMGLAVGAGAVWLAAAPGPITGLRGRRVVWKVHPATLTVRRLLRAECNVSLHAADVRLWVLDNCDGHLRSIDTRTGRWTISGFTLPRASAVTSAFGAVWVGNGSTVARVGARGTMVVLPVKGHALAASRRWLWVLDMGNGITGWLRRIDPETNRLVGHRIRLSAG
jgi:hypothetical protein